MDITLVKSSFPAVLRNPGISDNTQTQFIKILLIKIMHIHQQQCAIASNFIEHLK